MPESCRAGGTPHPPGLIVIGGKLLVYYLALWLLASAMIGFSEEIIFRGYLLATLATLEEVVRRAKADGEQDRSGPESDV